MGRTVYLLYMNMVDFDGKFLNVGKYAILVDVLLGFEWF